MAAAEILSVGASRRYQGPQRHYKLFAGEFAIDKLIDYSRERTSTTFAVVYHLGDKAGGGHYTSAVYHGGGWVSIDDSRISSLTETELTTFEPPRVPYLLFYRRLDSLISQQN